MSIIYIIIYIIIYLHHYLHGILQQNLIFSMIFTIIHIIIYLHHYLHQILQQNLNVKFTWFFTLIFYCNSCCLFTSIYTSKFTYNPKLIFRKMGWLLNLPNSFQRSYEVMAKISTVFPHIRPAGIIIWHSLQLRVLLENTTFLLHKIVRIAGIIRVAGIIRGRALYEEIR